jgi:DNA-binding MarR family transcriptional regulator
MGVKVPGDAQLEEMTGCVCFALRRTTRALTLMYDRALKAHGIRATQYPILLAARGNEPVPLGPMAERLGMDRTTLLRNVRPLVRRGLIEQSTEGDSRRTTLKTTPAGKALLKRAYPAWKEVQTRVLQKVGRSTWSRSLGALDEVTRATQR